MTKTFDGEFDGVDAWLNQPFEDKVTNQSHFASLTEAKIGSQSYRKVQLTESDLADPQMANAIFSTDREQLNESAGSNDDGKWVNSWEEQFFKQRSQKFNAKIEEQNRALAEVTELGLQAIGQARDLQPEGSVGALAAQLAEVVQSLNKLVLKEQAQATNSEEEPQGEELEPGEDQQQPRQASYDLQRRFKGIEDPKLLSVELAQLIMDMGDRIPAVKPIADELLELL